VAKVGVPVPPIVVVDGEDWARIHPSTKAAVAGMEAIDVEANEYRVYDSRGAILTLTAHSDTDIRIDQSDAPSFDKDGMRNAIAGTVKYLTGATSEAAAEMVDSLPLSVLVERLSTFQLTPAGPMQLLGEALSRFMTGDAEPLPTQQWDPLRRRWEIWKSLPYPEAQYPPGSSEGEVAGEDLALLMGDVAWVFHSYFTGRPVERVDSLVEAVSRALPHLRKPGRIYFAGALDLLVEIDERTGQHAAI
jgi:hypothetical protein